LPPKTSRVLAWISLLAGGVLLLVVLAGAAIVWRPSLIQPLIIKGLTPSGGSASIGKLEISLSPPRLVLLDFKRSHPSEPSVSLDRLQVNLDMSGLWDAGPWLELVEAEGLSLKIKPGPESYGQALDLGQLDLILAVKQAQVKNAHIVYLAKQGRLDLKVASLAVTPGQGKRRQFKLASELTWTDGAGQRLAWTQAKGNGVLDLSPSLEASLELAEGGLALPQLHGPLSGALKLKLSPQHIQVTQLDFKVAQGKGSLTPAEVNLHGQGGLEGGGLALELKRLDLGKLFSLKGGFKGSLKHGLSGDLKVQGRAELQQASIKQASLNAALGGSLAAPQIKSMALTIPADHLAWQGQTLPLGELQITGSGALEPGQRLRLDNLICKAEKLGDFQASLLLDEWRPRQASLNAAGLNAAILLAFVQKLNRHAAEGWTAQGKLGLEASLGREQSGQWRAELSTKDLGFSSADGSVLVGQMAGRLNASGGLADEPQISAQLKLSAGQALWGTIFLDLAKAPFELATQARIAAFNDLRQIKFSGRLGGMGRFSGQGQLALRKGVLSHQGSLALQDMDLTRLFNTFVRDPFSMSLPKLASWQVGGKARLDLKGEGQGFKSDISGRLIVSQASLQTSQGSSLGSLDLDLPISYTLGGAAPGQPSRPERKGWGSAMLKDVRLPGLKLASLEMPLALTPNRLWVLGSISVPLAGGKAVISDLAVDEPLSPKFAARFMAQLDGLNLAELGGPSLPLVGSIGGLLREVTLTKNHLRTKGRLEGRFFGGSLNVGGLAMALPFSPGREIRANIEARQVHMEPLSRALQVGRITGRLDAGMKGLRLAYGQPVVFQLKVESMETPGVDQDVSLKAVNSISLLGTGAGLSGMGLSLFASFFKEFPYEKIAFSCDLKNDVFRVKGLIHEDGVEYLVKRPMFMGINVINRNPDNRISFSDMLERLQRVQQDNAPREDAAEAKEER
jgi:hypothetical protein